MDTDGNIFNHQKEMNPIEFLMQNGYNPDNFRTPTPQGSAPRDCQSKYYHSIDFFIADDGCSAFGAGIGFAGYVLTALLNALFGVVVLGSEEFIGGCAVVEVLFYCCLDCCHISSELVMLSQITGKFLFSMQ
jgi:hypothetical protein